MDPPIFLLTTLRAIPCLVTSCALSKLATLSQVCRKTETRHTNRRVQSPIDDVRVGERFANSLVVQVVDSYLDLFASPKFVRFVVKQLPCKIPSLATDGYRIRYVRPVHYRVKERPFARGFNADVASLGPF